MPPTDFEPQGGPPAEPPDQHEMSDASPRWIAGVALVMVLGAIFMHATLGLLFASFQATGPGATSPLHPAPDLSRFPAPQLLVNGPADVASQLAVQRRMLEHQGWSDRPRGLAEIPIGLAMALLLHPTAGIPANGGPWPTTGVPAGSLQAMRSQVPGRP